MHGSTDSADGCIFVPEYIVDDLLALKSMPSPLGCTVLTVAFDIALFADVGVLKQPVAVPIVPVRTVARSQKRPLMFGQNHLIKKGHLI